MSLITCPIALGMIRDIRLTLLSSAVSSGVFLRALVFRGGVGQAISWNLQNEEWRAMSKEQVEENILCSAFSLHDEMGESIRCVVFRLL